MSTGEQDPKVCEHGKEGSDIKNDNQERVEEPSDRQSAGVCGENQEPTKGSEETIGPTRTEGPKKDLEGEKIILTAASQRIYAKEV